MAITYAAHCCGESVSLDYTPGSAVAAGDVLVLGNNVFLAKRAIEANQLGSIDIGGIWDLPKEASVAHNQGDLVYWDATNHVVTKTAGSNKKLGIAAANAASADTRGKYLSIPQAV